MRTVRHLVRVVGRVQGVGFRFATRSAAINYGITGCCRNLPDCSVEIEAEGDPQQVALFIEWCRQGPPRARVDVISMSELPPAGFSTFKIL